MPCSQKIIADSSVIYTLTYKEWEVDFCPTEYFHRSRQIRTIFCLRPPFLIRRIHCLYRHCSRSFILAVWHLIYSLFSRIKYEYFCYLFETTMHSVVYLHPKAGRCYNAIKGSSVSKSCFCKQYTYLLVT